MAAAWNLHQSKLIHTYFLQIADQQVVLHVAVKIMTVKNTTLHTGQNNILHLIECIWLCLDRQPDSDLFSPTNWSFDQSNSEPIWLVKTKNIRIGLPV